ncbi:MAG: hypothetical protein C5B47_07705 [Verrucomicrobia bacterium]|nr:MAG: hypothetical protein C5B47_07705 [Verrucomicrobiota bacterium]
MGTSSNALEDAMKFVKMIIVFLLCSGGGVVAASQSGPLPSTCKQVVIVITRSWNSSKGELEGYRRLAKGAWHREFGPIPVLLGKRGLAWGIGIAGQDQEGLKKQERDWRSPAGIFKIGKLYTYDRALPPGIDYPFVTMTARDVWISDPKSPNYNRHLSVDPRNPPPWYARERMRLGDPAHRYMLEIRHNAEHPIPGAGSAIFFHIQRGPTIPTSACTVMTQKNLLGLLRWLRPQDSPCYVLLPLKTYKLKQDAWQLPGTFLLKSRAFIN